MSVTQIESVSLNRYEFMPWNMAYMFWLRVTEPRHSHNQALLWINRGSKGQLIYMPTNREVHRSYNMLKYFHHDGVEQAMFNIPMNDMFDFSTPERVILSLRLFHQDFLTKHGIAIEADKTLVEDMVLPEGFDV